MVGCTFKKESEISSSVEDNLDEKSVLTISIKEKEIPYFVEQYVLDGPEDEKKEKEYAAVQLIKDLRESEELVPYVEIGNVILIHFEEDCPEKITLRDNIIYEDGHMKFQSNEALETSLTLEDSEAQYELAPHMAVAFSSDSRSYLDGNIYRGISFVYNWNGKDYEYTFVLRTDIK